MSSFSVMASSFHFSIPKLQNSSHNAPSIFFSLSPFCSSSFAKPTKIPSRNTPARDRIIDFGKHKGRKLGSLPSNYLFWISGNLRARDFEHWARLADEVLADEVYKDRLEWEAAQRVLTGDGGARSKPENSAAAELLEISQRFGWDYEDRAAWSRVDFALLGTSSGGRIPRKSCPNKDAILERESMAKERKVGILRTGKDEDRREMRRARRRKEKEMEMRRRRTRREDEEVVKMEMEKEDGNAGKVFDVFPGRRVLLENIERLRNRR